MPDPHVYDQPGRTDTVHGRTVPVPAGPSGPAGPPGPPDELTTLLRDTDFWSDGMVRAAGIPIVDVPFVTVGGGLGSFVTVDYLRIAGVPADEIRVLSNLDYPWQTYEYLTRVSQIPGPERIRSDSSSRPDNIWGFPSYAVGEAWRERTLKPLWEVFTEPLIADYWTPRVGAVFRGLEREAKRIGYPDMLSRGLVRTVRRRMDGGYFTILTPRPGDTTTQPTAYRSQFVHIAVGYPGLRFLPDLQALRLGAGDYHHVVNAYEPHEHVYQHLMTAPGTVVVRGGGIVASRVLQRIMDDRERNGAQTNVVHVFRTFVRGPQGPHPWLRQPGGDGWAYQGFNYPKSVWGGQLKAEVRKLDGEARARAYHQMGGTSTPYRRTWQRQLAAGRNGGYYTALQGAIEQVEVNPDGRLRCRIVGENGAREIHAEYIIDCTGLQPDITHHRVLKDLLDHGGAGRNPLGGLEVERHFEVKGTASGNGALYASGVATRGGYFPGVDTFLGLQIAAQEIAEDLARRGFARPLTVSRSTRQWFNWLLNRPV
ncbi:hypothetical protein Daura_28550 [Dactylosporangium aurantiacum]|uniref:FHA domain-containing protein n=1 Tax=Dactylosporangium aurantiacum TaxID=35754 RepID=A0A9Q9IC74_9ACTN|nr:hypothetical protein [Dactylosporangium aurantiacum]MDG6106602.1 hypothetical protein [Dactylosporangium aurantiacum]UWZ50764.1 hypothetical protein Daura_28550 [Dactylosporangium aurantiacum]